MNCWLQFTLHNWLEIVRVDGLNGYHWVRWKCINPGCKAIKARWIRNDKLN